MKPKTISKKITGQVQVMGKGGIKQNIIFIYYFSISSKIVILSLFLFLQKFIWITI